MCGRARARRDLLRFPPGATHFSAVRARGALHFPAFANASGLGHSLQVVRDKRARTSSRALARRAEKIAQKREKLARLDPGGSPQRPVEIASASVVELRAEREPCLGCEKPVRCTEHRVEGGLRVARVVCKECGRERSYYFRLGTPRLN